MSRRIVDVVCRIYIRVFSREKAEHGPVYKIKEIKEVDLIKPQSVHVFGSEDAFQYYTLYVCQVKFKKKYITLKSEEFDLSPVYFPNAQKIDDKFYDCCGSQIYPNIHQYFPEKYTKHGFVLMCSPEQYLLKDEKFQIYQGPENVSDN